MKHCSFFVNTGAKKRHAVIVFSQERNNSDPPSYKVTEFTPPKKNLSFPEIQEALGEYTGWVSEDIRKQYKDSSVSFLFLALLRSRYLEIMDFLREMQSVDETAFRAILVDTLERFDQFETFLSHMEATFSTLAEEVRKKNK